MDTQDPNPYAPPQEPAPKESWRLFIARGVIVLNFVFMYVSMAYTMYALKELARSAKIFSNPGDCVGFGVAFGFWLFPCVAIPGFMLANMLAKWIYPEIGKRSWFGRPRA